jgi:hypothetical protein
MKVTHLKLILFHSIVHVQNLLQLLVWIVLGIDRVAHNKSYAIKLTQISYTSMTCCYMWGRCIQHQLINQFRPDPKQEFAFVAILVIYVRTWEHYVV